MTLSQQNAVGPALRLFENAWSVLPDIYNEFLQHLADVIGKMKGLQPAKVSLTEITISDDLERKSVIGQLVAANAIARSELLKMYGLDYEDQVKKKIEEDHIMQEAQQEEAEKEQLQQANDSTVFGGGGGQQGGATAPGGGAANGGGSTPGDIQDQAQQIAQQLFPLADQDRRAKLQEIKQQNQTLWAAAKAALEEMSQEAKSNGVSQARQQAQSGGGQQPGAQ